MLNKKRGGAVHTEAGFFPLCKQTETSRGHMPSKEGEENRSWGVRGVEREGLKGVPLQIFKAAEGEF